jgi:hypothetical protein
MLFFTTEEITTDTKQMMYLAVSKDGGASFENMLISESTFYTIIRNFLWGLQQYFGREQCSKANLDPNGQW